MSRISFALSTVYASLVTMVTAVVLTIGAELSPAFKDWLKSLSGHHWKTKSYAVIGVFILSTFVFFVFTKNRPVSEERIRRGLIMVSIVAILGALTLTGFFISRFLGE